MITVDEFESYTEKGRDLLESVLPAKYARVAEALETIADTIFEEISEVFSEAQPEPEVNAEPTVDEKAEWLRNEAGMGSFVDSMRTLNDRNEFKDWVNFSYNLEWQGVDKL